MGVHIQPDELGDLHVRSPLNFLPFTRIIDVAKDQYFGEGRFIWQESPVRL